MEIKDLKAAMLAQHLGLNTCWVGLSYSKGKCPVDIAPGEKLSAVIALGYGATQGVARRFFEIGAAPQVVCWE